MSTFFLLCAVLGGGVLVLQVVLSLVGLADHDLALDGHAEAGDLLDLLSVRSVAAGLAFFGIGAMLMESLGVPALLAVPVGLAAGLAAAAAVTRIMRLMLRMESDGTVDLAQALGAEGTVYLSIPGGRSGPGKVSLTVQGRLLELQAVSEQPLANGAPVMVIGILGPETVEVVPSPVLGGVLDVPR